ncbi:hypothetical protein AB0C77_38145 [Streptomyces sp. NPDC048629]|uniref:hypothetical protein n=1 Tax=Streptomyces sp. NPDC048629 TaxID=3154824 RepID=UPI0034336763
MGRTGTIGRRALLAAGAVTLAGCSAPGGGGAKAPSAAERAARAELALRHSAVAASTGLLERYDATRVAHPALAARLTPLRTSVAAHAAALGEGLPAPSAKASEPSKPSDEPSAAPSGKPSPASATRVTAPVAADPAVALKDLAAAARRTADAHAAALLDAPPEYARLLASVAAAAAAHAYLLTAPAPARSPR